MVAVVMMALTAWVVSATGADDVSPQEEVDSAISQATLNPRPPIGGARQFGASEDEQVPLGALKPSHKMVDVSVEGVGFGGLQFSRNYAGTPDTWMPAKAVKQLGSPFGHVEDWDTPAEAPALQWWHNLHSYVLIRVETRCEGLGNDRFCNDVTYWSVRGGPAGLKKDFTSCAAPGCFGFNRSEQDVRLQWDGSGFVVHAADGRYHYRNFRELQGVNQQLGVDESNTWPGAWFLSYVEAPQYDESLCAAEGVEDAGGAVVASCHRRTVRLGYGVPSECAADAGTTMGSDIPMLQTATAAAGSKLVFHYQSLPSGVSSLLGGPSRECVLESVELGGKDGTTAEQEVVRYGYQDGGAGLLSSVEWPGADGGTAMGTRVDYAYLDTSGHRMWEVRRDGVLVVRQAQDDAKGHILSDQTLHRTHTVSAENNAVTPDAGPVPFCAPGHFGNFAASSGCKPSQMQYFRAFNPTVGDGTGAQVPEVDHSFDMGLAGLGPQGDQGPVLRGAQITCTSALDCRAIPPGGIETSWGVRSLPVVTDARLWVDVAGSEQHPNSAYTVYEHALPTQAWKPDSGSTPSYLPPAELRQVYLGADGADGGSPLLRQQYTYLYGGAARPTGARAYEQLLEGETAPSAFTDAPNLTRQVHRQYDAATNRLKGVIRSGWTQVFNASTNAWQRQARYIGTFYSTSNACGTPAADPKGRVRAVIGPCRVQGLSSTTCDVTAPTGQSPYNVPIAEYEYWADSSPGNKAGRLKSKSVYPTSTTAGCGTTSIVTSFDDYDARGRLLQQTDANGTVTRFEYEGERLVRKVDAVGDSAQEATTEYGYDDDATHGDYVKDALNRYDVLCYRTGTLPGQGCKGGQRTDLLQWKATSAFASGATYSERVDYTYYQGRLASETFRDASGQVRRTRYYEGDPLGRATFESWGATGPATASANNYSQTGLFDGEGNRVGLGLPFQPTTSAPEPLCGGFDSVVLGNSGVPQPASPQCKAMAYDKLNRLTGLLEPLDTTSTSGEAVQACMTYDPVGNLKSVKQGCPRGARVGDCSACTQPVIEFQHDDFGNLVAVQAPWTNGAAHHFEYDAAGGLVRKQTPTMAGATTPSWLEYRYDALGRTKLAESVDAANVRQTLYSYAYDADVTPPVGCPGHASVPTRRSNAMGRAQVLTDSFGDTWYQYDSRGRLFVKWRVRAHATVPARTGICGGDTTGKERPSHGTFYDRVGRLLSEAYPGGRTLLYHYYSNPALSHRVQAIEVSVRATADTWEGHRLIDDIQWAPFGGVESYSMVALKAPSGANRARVVYHTRGSNIPLARCDKTDFIGGSDTTGRLFGLTVSTEEGVKPGDIFKRVYTWKADQQEREDTCLLETGEVAPSTVFYKDATTGASGYDSRLQLRKAYRVDDPAAAAGGSFASRSYQYDARGNRTEESLDGWKFTGEYLAGGSRVDLLTARSLEGGPCGTSSCAPGFTVTQRYSHDADGRVVEVAGYKYKTDGVTSPFYSLSLDASTDGANAAVGAVYREVTDSEGRSYEYFYDAAGRRRLKRYAVSSGMGLGLLEEEFFYDGTKLLEDRGNSTLDPATAVEVRDDYLWLDGRPVAMFKTRRDSAGLWVQDFSGDCPRNGEAAPCGLYFIVADGLGKPVLMLDSWRRVTGVGDHDPFGHVNRTTLAADAPLPALNQNALMALLKAPASTATTTWLRARLSILDVQGGSGVYLANSSGTQVLSVTGASTLLSNRAAYMATTPWALAQGDGSLQLRFKMASSQTYAHDAALVGFEYRRFQTGASPVWTPLRLPGQYHDTETDLFENWNRYYDATAGLYLGPDLAVYDPTFHGSQTAMGKSAPVYTYTFNSPLGLVDPDGLVPCLADDGEGGKVEGECIEVEGPKMSDSFKMRLWSHYYWRYEASSVERTVRSTLPRSELEGIFDIPHPNSWGEESDFMACVSACIEACDPLNSIPGVSSSNLLGGGIRGGFLASSPWPKGLTPFAWAARGGASPYTSIARLLNIGMLRSVGVGVPSQAIKAVGRVGPVSMGYGLTMTGLEGMCFDTCSQ